MKKLRMLIIAALLLQTVHTCAIVEWISDTILQTVTSKRGGISCISGAAIGYIAARMLATKSITLTPEEYALSAWNGAQVGIVTLMAAGIFEYCNCRNYVGLALAAPLLYSANTYKKFPLEQQLEFTLYYSVLPTICGLFATRLICGAAR